MADLQVIFGLGNPGAEYERTRHNIGQWFIERLANRFDGQFNHEKKLHADVCRINAYGTKLWLVFPTTFMNESGQAVRAFTDYYKISATNILVAYDELDLPPGTARLKQQGGTGGHNGLRSIVRHLGTQQFLRLRFGIGHPGHKDRVTPYVLGRPPAAEENKLYDAIDAAINIMPDLVAGEVEKATLELHTE